jgi:hypothetical protein
VSCAETVKSLSSFAIGLEEKSRWKGGSIKKFGCLGGESTHVGSPHFRWRLLIVGRTNDAMVLAL